ncbi:MFS transporter [Natronorarus salvus]|uniref:MFS transporter n=1 Tax=Natronorarus salvus TaxID=3117733 RepID=UPI002F25EBD8
MEPLASLRGFSRTVYVVAVARFVNVLGSGMVYPFAVLYFYGEVGIPFTLVGIGLLANNVALAVGTVLGGMLSDRYGRKPVMVASMALSAPALASYALVSSAPEFVLVASVAGLVMGLLAPASQAMVADVTESDARDRSYGLLKVASNAGFGSGFVVGGFLYGIAETLVFVANGATSAVVALWLLVALAPSPARDGDSEATVGLRGTLVEWRRAVSHPTIVGLALLNVGFAIAYAQMQSTVPVHAEATFGLSSEQLGTLYVLNPLVVVLFQIPVVTYATRWRRTRGLVISAGFWAASFLAIALSYLTSWQLGVALLGAFLVLRTVGELLHAPIVTALASDVGTVETRGSQLSVLEVAKRIGFGIGPVLGGLFFDYGVDTLLWPALIVLCAGLVVGLLALERRVTPTQNGRAIPAD